MWVCCCEDNVVVDTIDVVLVTLTQTGTEQNSADIQRAACVHCERSGIASVERSREYRSISCEWLIFVSFEMVKSAKSYLCNGLRYRTTRIFLIFIKRCCGGRCSTPASLVMTSNECAYLIYAWNREFITIFSPNGKNVFKCISSARRGQGANIPTYEPWRRRGKDEKKNLHQIKLHLKIEMPNVRMRANHCYFAVFILLLLYARMRSFEFARYVRQWLACSACAMCIRWASLQFVSSFEWNMFLFFSCDHLLWKSDNMHLVCWCFFLSIRCAHAKAVAVAWHSQFLNWKIKMFSIRSHSESELNRCICHEGNLLTADPWCVSAAFILKFISHSFSVFSFRFTWGSRR